MIVTVMSRRPSATRRRWWCTVSWPPMFSLISSARTGSSVTGGPRYSVDPLHCRVRRLLTPVDVQASELVLVRRRVVAVAQGEPERVGDVRGVVAEQVDRLDQEHRLRGLVHPGPLARLRRGPSELGE